MLEGKLVKWNKKEGDKVKPGEVIAEVETDKATMEVESVDEGVLAKIVVPGGTEAVKVNTLIGILLEEGEDESAVAEMLAAEQSLSSQTQGDLGPQATNTSDNSTGSQMVRSPGAASQRWSSNLWDDNPSGMTTSSRLLASPVAKRLAHEAGLNLASIQGTGPQGRIIKSDVLNATATSAHSHTPVHGVRRITPEHTELPISGMRSTIAKRLVESKQFVPHFYLTVDCNVSKLLEMREELNTQSEGNPNSYKITVNDFIIKAVGLALKQVPEANITWQDRVIARHNNIDVSVAVAIEGGLITPIIRNADQKSILAISKEMKELASRAKQGALKPSEYQGGSVNISNLGMYGIKSFSAIINPPQSFAFAIGAAHEEAVVVNGKVVISHVMSVTLSCDHRAIDGAVGAQVLKAFKEYIERPSRLLV
jgi:pyruvate dehydrogenase E2 component (dihydrolipoamide acetyltransferase)